MWPQTITQSPLFFTMDNTLDTIMPSTSKSQDDMSYLFGRDPSILTYGQRPCVLKDTKRNLLSSYESEECQSAEENSSLKSESQKLQTVKVYLRMKPFPKKLKLTEEHQDAYKIINSNILSTKLPALDTNMSSFKRSTINDVISKKYTFTKTFGPETTQLELFEEAVKQQMTDFLAGQNSTIMTYGTTNSGKSYTLQGTTTSPGIIPRCLEFVFSNITPKSTPSYKPINHCDVVTLDPLERAQELEIKTKLLTFASVDKHKYINAYKEMRKLLQEESPIRPSQCIDAHYSVWVSFAEIYNEIVYDLLSNECQKNRTPLKLTTDSQGRTFIKGLKTISVNSGSEAYQVLMAGQYNLKVAATALNARSSRSHCIFTIKLLKYYVENDPDYVEVSTFAFCDLAGSERLKKTLNSGERLKEAKNINTSLLVLGRCLKTIHEGQLLKQKIEHIGPFRESKLTRLFQKALSGKEHMALIVNINPLPNLYVETQNVLNFSAIAKKIVIEQKQKAQKKKSRFSQIVTQSIKTVTDWDATELESEEWQNTGGDDSVVDYVKAEDYEELLSINERLKKEIATLKSSALTREFEIREEMADTYTVMMKELDAEWKNRINDMEEEQEDVRQWSVKQVEDFYKEKLNQLSNCKRKRLSIVDNVDDDIKNIEELEIQNSRLTSKIILLKNNVKKLKETNQTVTVEKNKVTFELGITKEDLKSVKNLLDAVQQDVCSNEDVKCFTEELKSQLFAKQEQVKKLKVFLNEAKEEYISITTEMREKEYVIKEQEEELFEKQEMIDDLEADLENINICLTEKSKVVEVLGEKVESQNKRIIDNESKIQNMQDQINKLESEKLLLLNEVESLKQTASNGHSMKASECKSEVIETSSDSPKDDKCQEIIVEDVSCNLNLKVLNETCEGGTSDTKDVKIDNEELDSQMREKIVIVEIENLALKEKLIQSTTEIQSLKEELEVTKVKLKSISDQISDLKIRGEKSEVQVICTQDKESVETVETGCQTIECTTKEEKNQTSFVDEDNTDDALSELAKLTVKYDDMKSQYKEKCVMLEELEQEIQSLKQTIENLSKETDTNKVVTAEYKQSTEVLQKELSLAKEDTARLEQALQDSNNIKVSLEAKVHDYEQRLDETEKELLNVKDDYTQCTECLDVHAAKIAELEQNVGNITELQQQFEELNKNLKVCKIEKDHLQTLLGENNVKLSDLENRLEHAEEKEREKDDEIISLQKDIKKMIQTNENDDRNDKLMESGLKNTIKDLTETRELLSQKEKYIGNLESRLKSSEQNVKVLECLQQSVQERKVENERLRNVNEELRNSLIEKEREMETFMRNRDEMVSKYEVLVKSQQEELEKQKQELTKSQSKGKEHYENTSEDEVVLKERRVRRPPKRYAYSPQQEDISVVEVPGSSSKRGGKRIDLLPPPVEPVSEGKRNNRKKKLYTVEDDSVQSIEPLESSISSTPSSKPRSLRSRRKK